MHRLVYVCIINIMEYKVNFRLSWKDALGSTSVWAHCPHVCTYGEGIFQSVTHLFIPSSETRLEGLHLDLTEQQLTTKHSKKKEKEQKE